MGMAADIHSTKLDAFGIYTAIGGLVNEGSFNIGQCILYRKSHFVHVSLPNDTHRNEFIIRNK